MKKLLPLIIAALMVIPTAMTAQTAKTHQWKGAPYKLPTTTKKGDVNCDGNVSITDVTTLVDVILTGLPQNTDASVYDINGDGDVTVSDVTGLVDMILNGSGIGDTSQAYLTCPDDNHPHIIDLGLPSGTKWACCNVGATKPEEYGGYYAWGETEEKISYDWSNYLYFIYFRENIPDIVFGQNLGIYNVNGYEWYDIAGTGYDVAYVKWGGSWVMPSEYQINELIENTSFKWTTKNNVDGQTFTGQSGGSIFLPAAGERVGNHLDNAGVMGHYCGSVTWPDFEDPSVSCLASCLAFVREMRASDGGNREQGHTVRPVWVP